MQVMGFVLLLGALLVALGSVGLGLLMLLRPEWVEKWRAWQVRRWTDAAPASEAGVGVGLETRIAGIIIVAIGGMFVWICRGALFSQSLAAPAAVSSPGLDFLSSAWQSIGLGFLILSTALSILMNKDLFTRWSYRTFYPGRVLRDDRLPELRIWVRRMGLMLVVIGVYMMIVGVHRLVVILERAPDV